MNISARCKLERIHFILSFPATIIRTPLKLKYSKKILILRGTIPFFQTSLLHFLSLRISESLLKKSTILFNFSYRTALRSSIMKQISTRFTPFKAKVYLSTQEICISTYQRSAIRNFDKHFRGD